MSRTATEYAQMLKNLLIPKEVVKQTADIFAALPQVEADLSNPVMPVEKKHNIVEKVFPAEIRDFLKLLCDNQKFSFWGEIFEAYKALSKESEDVLPVTIFYVTAPDESQLQKIKEFLAKKYDIALDKIEIELKEDPDLLGGFIIRAGNQEFDWSMRGRLQQMKEQMKKGASSLSSSDEIINILKTEIEQSEFDKSDREIGIVKQYADGIATVDGIDHAMFGEIVIFDTGVKGMVQDIRLNEIGCILFGRDSGMKEGTRVIRTGRNAGNPVGENFLGRVIDALGSPIDGKGEIQADGYRPIENKAPGIVDRKSVNQPLETGILAIDSMFPIGRGQRELIIGDRQTGKTTIATDTIINQKGKDVICIYVAIGQKASTVAKVESTLRKYGAMDYSIIVSATASDPASLQYIAPYSGTAMAEYFMYKGRDVLIVYDDLSKHAVAYRSLSLLLERSPGREAYPGDVFYLHSRLLERSSKLTPELGGGSITALPIIETQAGDVSAYIPTNVISITDGQIFLQSDLFFSGQRPAVNVGLSVSRVGGAAQTKAMKKASGSIRIDLAQYREMEVFTQFSSDLDEETQYQLNYGKGLMELLKQPACKPLSMAEQVILLYVATHKGLVDIRIEEFKEYREGLLEFFMEKHPEIIRELEDTKKLSDELAAKILEAAGEYKDSRWVKCQI
ncbi:MAG: F0F1 ATP synthase subunit alpha [Clostridiales bacterium]|nr:F0F1 ATP synthase subunit alpha [Clostridiales bacterium]